MDEEIEQETLNPANIHVFVPDRFGGLVVCELQQLYFRCDDEIEYDELVSNAGFDSTMARTIEHMREHFKRVYELNQTGNVDKYWNTTDE